VIREDQKHIKEKAYEIATLSKKLRDEIRRTFSIFPQRGWNE
jgi:hypothetical protein